MCQPDRLMGRRSGEHWAGRLYMRSLSPYATWLFVRAGIAPNQITWLMIASGVAAGAVLGVGGSGAGGLASGLVAALLVQLYLLLDCSDGEVARWTNRTSITGVYLDRVGHYFCEAALLIGLGMRAQGSFTAGIWVVAGLAAALGAILIKAETDIVDVARARSGLAAATEQASAPRGSRLGHLRRLAATPGFHRVIQAVELSLLVAIAAVYDMVTGGLLATRVLTAVCVAVAALQMVAHLVSILVSRRLT